MVGLSKYVVRKCVDGLVHMKGLAMKEKLAGLAAQAFLVNLSCKKSYSNFHIKEMEMQKAKMSMSEEEFKQHQKMKRLEAEAQEEVL